MDDEVSILTLCIRKYLIKVSEEIITSSPFLLFGAEWKIKAQVCICQKYEFNHGG